MARAKKKRKREQARRLHQEPVVRRVAEILASGRPTLFRHESACRHGLRAGLCLEGMKWEPADQRARQIVTLALHRAGASLRPTWSVGQPQRVGREYFYCTQCQGFMPEGSDTPWCGDDCRYAFHSSAYDHAHRRDDTARREAIRAILTGGAEPPPARSERSCKGCSKLFLPKEPRQRFCTQPCAVKSVRMTRRAEPRPCAICATSFTPCAETALYCGPACVAEATRRSHRAAREKRELALAA